MCVWICLGLSAAPAASPMHSEPICKELKTSENKSHNKMKICTCIHIEKTENRWTPVIIMSISGVLTGQIEPIIQQCIALDEQEH